MTTISILTSQPAVPKADQWQVRKPKVNIALGRKNGRVASQDEGAEGLG
jgi:hypothetical protein